MLKDPIVEEVRNTRKELASELGYDFVRISEFLYKAQMKWSKKLVTRADKSKGEEILKESGNM